MIVLTVIGVLSAVLLPVARNAMPDNNVMKFKKAYNGLATTIKELANSDLYFLNGDFAIKADGTYMTDDVYFCNAFSDFFATQEKVCKSRTLMMPLTAPNGGKLSFGGLVFSNTQYDSQCKSMQANNEWDKLSYIYTSDGIYYYFPIAMGYAFGADIRATPYIMTDENGFKGAYGMVCFDIDEINEGEEPFGVAVRADGKIAPDLRVNEWFQKSIQNKD